MKNRRLRAAALLAALFSAALALALGSSSCSMDALFHNISMERPPRPPKIPGGPSKMVLAENWDGNGQHVMLVASGNLFWLTADGWGADIGLYQPPGRTVDVAATSGFLYALTMDLQRLRSALWRMPIGGGSWAPVAGDSVDRAQSIFALGNRLFASVRTGNEGSRSIYDILHITDAPSDAPALALLHSDAGMLSGAAGGFLSTREGLFRLDGNSATRLALAGAAPPSDGISRNFMGMIELPGGAIVAVTRVGGGLYKVDANGFSPIPVYSRPPGCPCLAVDACGNCNCASGACAAGGCSCHPPSACNCAGCSGTCGCSGNGNGCAAGDCACAQKCECAAVACAACGGNRGCQGGCGSHGCDCAPPPDPAPTGGSRSLGWNATGALAVWTNPADTSRQVLAAGIQGGGNASGYVELVMESGMLHRYEPRRDAVNSSPAHPLWSVGGEQEHSARYRTSLGRIPVNHLFQAPAQFGWTFFASTQSSGLWSFREDSRGIRQWNAEE